jgi:hypothetical protein
VDRKKFLQVVAVFVFTGGAVLVPASMSAAVPPRATCTVVQARTHQCGQIQNDRLVVDTSKSVPGGGRVPENRPAGSSDSTTPQDDDCPPGALPAACEDFGVVDPSKPSRPGGAVTIHDLRDFRPAAGVDHAQPNGWAIVGLDANFYATVPPETQHGRLLGERADVRFIPVSWRWTYGDGASAAKTTAGTTWTAQGEQEFDPTPTSHVYRVKGSYTVSLEIEFSAEYRYAASVWTPVAGTIAVAANRLAVTAITVKTVLVSRDCIQDPTGPGC